MPKSMTYIASNKLGISKDLVDTENKYSSSKHMFGFIGDVLFNPPDVKQFEKDFERTDIKVEDARKIYERKANSSGVIFSEIEHERLKTKNDTKEAKLVTAVQLTEIRKLFMESKEHNEQKIIKKISKLNQGASAAGLANIVEAMINGECRIKTDIDNRAISFCQFSGKLIEQTLTKQGEKYIYKMTQPFIPYIDVTMNDAFLLDKVTGQLVKISDFQNTKEFEELDLDPENFRLTYPGKVEITLELDLTPGKEVQYRFSNKLVLDNGFDVQLKDGKKVENDSENMIFKTNRVKVHNDPIKNLKIIKQYINKSLPSTLKNLDKSTTEEQYLANLKVLKRRLSKLEFYIDSAGSNNPEVKKVINIIKSKIKPIAYITQHRGDKLNTGKYYLYSALNKISFGNFFQTELDAHKKIYEAMDILKEADNWKFIEEAKSILPEVERCLVSINDKKLHDTPANINILSNIPDKKISIDEKIKHDKPEVKAKLTSNNPPSNKI